jgi:crotonobetainyl-CoA:carnitine CoA-transferase CaiB-like acyl-CoA transferase
MATAPLADVKILDFMWVMAGPAATRVLADFGATVVRVESPTRIDTARTLGPFHNNQSAPDASGLFNNCNAGKLGITLDLGNPAAKEVVADLVRWADVVTESFSPKAMRAWGFDYDQLRRIKPDLIMLSTCLMGQTGPHAKIAGFGTMAAAISGFHNLTGWPDRPPSGPFGAYTDYIAPKFTAMALLAALEYRRRTGQGQYIDQSQAESSLHFLGPALLDYTANGRVDDRAGNNDPDFAPHNAYPCAGEDRWVAIVCRSDEDWRRLSELMRRFELGADPRYATAAARLERRAELDSIVGAWTRGLEPRAAEALLQSRGIAAYEVQNSAEAYTDPQLRSRDHFLELPHPVHDKTTVEGTRQKLSRTPAEVHAAGPTLGQHNQYVFEKILGYSEERISELVAAGVLG